MFFVQNMPKSHLLHTRFKNVVVLGAIWASPAFRDTFVTALIAAYEVDTCLRANKAFLAVTTCIQMLGVARAEKCHRCTKCMGKT